MDSNMYKLNTASVLIISPLIKNIKMSYFWGIPKFKVIFKKLNFLNNISRIKNL